MKRKLLLLLALSVAMLATGCIQEKLFIPVATVTGKIVVPAGKDPIGIKITVAGNPSITTYVNETGDYKLEFPKTGRYLLVARSKYYDVDYVWVDAFLEQTVKADNLSLKEKIVGEVKFLATIVDYPNAEWFKVKSITPVWATDTVSLYDDGTHDDRLANDGIFTLRLTNLATGYQQYHLIWYGDKDGEIGENTEKLDPHREAERVGNSEMWIREPEVKLARGRITSALTGVNYSEVTLATKGGARKMLVNSDGTYSIAMEGNGREYLVFRSVNFHVRAIPVDLTTVPIYDVPDTVLKAKAPGEIKLVLVKNDFQDVLNPMVVGEFTDWHPEAMYDDGTHGDEVSGDGVYTYTKSGVGPGYYKYAYNIREGNQVRDPYEESGDSSFSILTVK
ncbi:MAG TPA: hypothetical protein PKO06_00770 [Candidatus Ozemobacteraceae bacterium]|nr:hypothetical protein [Candidatus Ozemobacteraceae bacterium]